MKLAFCAAVWGRLPLTALWWRGLTRLRRYFEWAGLTTAVFVAGSEPEHEALCHAYAGNWLPCPNDYLGRKHNATTEAAGQWGADYVMVLGSDDFLSDTLVPPYLHHMWAQASYIGLPGLYFYEPATDRASWFPGYPEGHRTHGHPIGCGRMVSRSVLESRGWSPWSWKKTRGLDANMRRVCRLENPALIEVGGERVAVDVKTDTNLWTFDQIAMAHPGSCYVAPDFLDVIPEGKAIRALGPQRQEAT